MKKLRKISIRVVAALVFATTLFLSVEKRTDGTWRFIAAGVKADFDSSTSGSSGGGSGESGSGSSGSGGDEWLKTLDAAVDCSTTETVYDKYYRSVSGAGSANASWAPASGAAGLSGSGTSVEYYTGPMTVYVQKSYKPCKLSWDTCNPKACSATGVVKYTKP